ncbi:uncharacterized protein HD556DRAFT_1310729 [Suillus plorans]|uniref:Uncharacterized protein n=1 Tax=Suillus plorans TaxID=116603 RepID=A0A9P7AKJ4_9AGAM|nr:uncharacterized protein HD556DRAFT_1310729 [Suillus plorans]KAG1790333.1 hypothetical protein HD556DRAFT_1310729 [Suillus plorans]
MEISALHTTAKTILPSKWPSTVKHHSTPLANRLAIQSSTDTCAQFETSLQISTLREPSVHEINKGVWRKKIITEIRGRRHGVHDSQSFSHVSINDYEYIVEAIAGDDDQYNPSYTPSSSQLIVILPSPIYENFLMPLRKSMDAVFVSMGITPEYATAVETEVSYSETQEDILSKLQDYIDSALHIDSSKIFDTLNKVELVVPFHKWIHKYNKPFPRPVTVFRHNWVSTVTVTVTTWLRHPARQLDLDDHNNEFYQCMLAAKDAAEESSGDESNSDEFHIDKPSTAVEDPSLLACCTWVPPALLFNWEMVVPYLQRGLKQTGYNQYSSWYENLLKCKALEMENSSGGGSTKRSRKV